MTSDITYDILISIKPEFVDRILSGKKLYEFRTRRFARNVNRIYIYSSAPVQRIVASFKPGVVIIDKKERVWAQCKDGAGISQERFFKRFAKNETVVSIKIDDLVSFDRKDHPGEYIKYFKAPQSFMYFEKGSINEYNSSLA